MEEEKTLAIPLGGSTADGEQVQPTVGPVESAATGGSSPQQKSGKAKKAGMDANLDYFFLPAKRFPKK